VKAIIESPIKAYIYDYENDFDRLTRALTYKNISVQFQINKLYQNLWFRKSNPEEWKRQIDQLKQALITQLIFDDNGRKYIRPGSIPYLKEYGINIEVVNNVKYPNPKPRPWYNKLPFELYYYQKEAVEKLIEAKHGAVSIATGGGKSACIMSIVRNLGLKSIIMTPSSSIFRQLLKEAEFLFGKASVGALGDGIKRLGKPIMVCVSKSLTTLDKNSKEYKELSEYEVLLGDESHTLPAETLEQVCHGVLANVPYRFFFSGTQVRGDGSDKLLHSIIGPVVYTLSTAEAIQGGFICNHEFVIKKVSSKNKRKYSDPLKNKREHFLKNEEIADFIAKIATAAYQTKNHKTLVLVDELSQISLLIKKLTIPYAYAHSATDKKELEKLGLEKVDSEESIEKFNKGEVAILIGTSAISTGVNIFPTHHTFNWQGGSSETKTKQGAVGRSVRLLEKSKYKDYHPPKEKSIIWDFDVDIDDLRSQLNKRIRYYKESGTKIVRLE
jgi:superfamily II DNA or RNA helicase